MGPPPGSRAANWTPPGGKASGGPPSMGPLRDHQEASDAPAGDAAVHQPTPDEWAKILAGPCLAHGIQLSYALKWMAVESGGNPCTVGYAPAHGAAPHPGQPPPWPEYPLEMGIAQLYNPNDLQDFGVTAPELRAYCVPGDQHEVRIPMHDGTVKIVRGFSGRMARPITVDEMVVQVNAMVALIARSMREAARDLLAVHAGSSWSPVRRDYWAMVKLQHGLPELSREGLPAVTKKLGRPPASWSEFRTNVVQVPLTHAESYRSSFPIILRNAEETASAFSESEVA